MVLVIIVLENCYKNRLNFFSRHCLNISITPHLKYFLSNITYLSMHNKLIAVSIIPEFIFVVFCVGIKELLSSFMVHGLVICILA